LNQLPTAVFLDRDGTIIEDAHYLSRPEQVKLLPGAADAIARINAQLIPVIVVTNQSGIARGILTADEHEQVTRHLNKLLGRHGARIDATYFCPHAPEDGCDCRKPGTLLYRNAKRDYPEIDLARSLYLGDRFRDLEPAITFGGTGVLIPSPETPESEIEAAEARARVAPSLGTALDWYLCTN
jgi:D-glycero-D-manno-heptose 1,7-bisphosphate phosphatase